MDEQGLGQKLQAARKAAGLTQQTLCQKANISYSTLAKIERGAIKSPSIFTIQSLVAALGGSLDELMEMHRAIADATGTPRSKRGIEFVYFDLNGCLVHYFQRAFTALARRSGVSADAIEDLFWRHNAAVCNGQMSMHSFNGLLAKRCGLDSVDWQAEYIAAVEPVAGMEAIVAWADQSYRVGLLTNSMPGLVDGLLAAGKLPQASYEIVIDSSVVGSSKPDSAIFAIAAERTGLKPSQLLLVDDERDNVEVAETLGWHAICSDDIPAADLSARVHETLELI